MGKKATIKLMRKQIRNVAQEHYQNALTAEAIQNFDKKFTEHASKRLDLIAAATEKEVRTMDSQTREFRKLMITDIGLQLSRELFEINVNLLSWQRALLKELGMGKDIESFAEKVEAEKAAVRATLEAEAAKKQAEEEAAAKAKAEEAAKLKAEADLKASKEGIPVEETTNTSETQVESA